MRVLAIGSLLLAIVVAMPASAQIAGSMRGLSGSNGPSFRGSILRPPAADPTMGQRVSIAHEVDDMRDDIREGREAGQLSRKEARALGREGRRIDWASARYARGGYTYAELSMLRNRTEALRSAIVAKRTQAIQKKSR